MRILLASAELSPFAIVGGLGSAVGGLVSELRALGHDVEVMVPDYNDVVLEQESIHSVAVPPWAGSMTLRSGIHSCAGPVTLVGSDCIARPNPYVDSMGNGWPDNDLRFFSFSAAVAAHANENENEHRANDKRYDVVHLNDWHTSATAAWLDPAIATVLSVHNLAYQGDTSTGWLEHFGDRRGAFERHGRCNPLGGGLQLADAVVVVSENYRNEILRPENAFGLHDVLSSRRDSLVGIRNGIETEVWDPATDRYVSPNFAVDTLGAKFEIRDALRSELGLDGGPTAGSLAVVLSRLVEQKGIDIIVELLHQVDALPSQLAVLGAGDSRTVMALRAAADENPRRVAFVEGYETELGHRLLAGGDFVLMPSRFEPCGLTQMQAMRYGTIPVVSGVGGLVDTVIDADANRTSGTGFVTSGPATPMSFLDAWHRGKRAWSNASRRAAIQRRGMTADWSWHEPALRHVALYESLGCNRA